jgi:hypothetical protein
MALLASLLALFLRIGPHLDSSLGMKTHRPTTIGTRLRSFHNLSYRGSFFEYHPVSFCGVTGPGNQIGFACVSLSSEKKGGEKGRTSVNISQVECNE